MLNIAVGQALILANLTASLRLLQQVPLGLLLLQEVLLGGRGATLQGRGGRVSC